MVNLADEILQSIRSLGYKIDEGPGFVNIVYRAGTNLDGTPNENRTNAFDDLRMVLMVVADQPVILGKWKATIETGEYYTENPINPKGAARIAFGQFEAWQVGIHRSNHEALIQTGGEVTVYRDANEDYNREGDKPDTGYFGINQHGGYDMPDNNIGKASAGCLVGNHMSGHREFMKIVKGDKRYKEDNEFVFRTTILAAPKDDV